MSSKSSDSGTPANRSSASTVDLERRSTLEEGSESGGYDAKDFSSAKPTPTMSSAHHKAMATVSSTGTGGQRNEKSSSSMMHSRDQLVQLQKESMVIEDSMMVANRVVQFQRGEAQIVIAEAMEAKRLAERELLERENLEDSNKHAAVDRNKRKEIKSFLMDVVNLLKDKQMEAKHLREAQTVATALRLSLQQKRNAFQLLQKNVEDRERIERIQLQEGHDRSSKNLVVWQELELRQQAADVR